MVACWDRLAGAGCRSHYQETAIDLAAILRPSRSLALPAANHSRDRIRMQSHGRGEFRLVAVERMKCIAPELHRDGHM